MEKRKTTVHSSKCLLAPLSLSKSEAQLRPGDQRLAVNAILWNERPKGLLRTMSDFGQPVCSTQIRASVFLLLLLLPRTAGAAKDRERRNLPHFFCLPCSRPVCFRPKRKTEVLPPRGEGRKGNFFSRFPPPRGKKFLFPLFLITALSPRGKEGEREWRKRNWPWLLQRRPRKGPDGRMEEGDRREGERDSPSRFLFLPPLLLTFCSFPDYLRFSARRSGERKVVKRAWKRKEISADVLTSRRRERNRGFSLPKRKERRSSCILYVNTIHLLSYFSNFSFSRHILESIENSTQLYFTSKDK